MHESKPVIHTPLLTPEELEALIQAYNRRDSGPRPRSAWLSAGTMVLLLCMLAVWWWR
jgi:hypothetical protein